MEHLAKISETWINESDHVSHSDSTTKDSIHSSVAASVYTCPMHPEIQEDHPGTCPKCGMALEPMGESIAATRTEYTCPMHPEVIQDHPGNCPKCGMALEPRTVDVEERTEGKPQLISVQATPGFDESEVLRLAASLERASEHPLAEAIVRGAKDKGIELASINQFDSITGQGVTGVIDTIKVALGNLKLLESLSVAPGELQAEAEKGRKEGQTVMFVSIDGKAVGLIGVADPIKNSTPQAISDLHAEGVRVVMLTGDNRTTAQAVADRLGIDRVEAEVLPHQKAEIVSRLQAEGRIVAMAGDGINDAPALAQSHVGIAMGTGADVAMESAGVTLVKGDLRGIVRARRLSRGTMRNIRQNLFFAFIYNSLGVPVAAGVLYPVFGLLLSPIIAAAAMSFSSVSVIGNALRLRRAAV